MPLLLRAAEVADEMLVERRRQSIQGRLMGRLYRQRNIDSGLDGLGLSFAFNNLQRQPPPHSTPRRAPPLLALLYCTLHCLALA